MLWFTRLRGVQVEGCCTKHAVGRGGGVHAFVQRTAYLPACFALWLAGLMASQAVREAAAFVPGFVPWSGESPESFRIYVGRAAFLGVVALAVTLSAKHTSVRSAGSRFVNGLGLWPSSRQHMLRWLVVGMAMAAALIAAAQIISRVPGLTSVPDTEDPRSIAVAHTSIVIRFLYGLIAPAPLEELLYRGPVLALWLVFLAAQFRGGWLGQGWVRWLLLGGLSVVSAAAFAADHTMGGGVNVAHAAVLAVMATAVVLWQRSLWPALIAHALYDACVFAWG